MKYFQALEGCYPKIDIVVFFEVDLTVSPVVITFLAGLRCLEPVSNQTYLLFCQIGRASCRERVCLYV